MNRYAYFAMDGTNSSADGIFLRLPEDPEDIKALASAFAAAVARGKSSFRPPCRIEAFAGTLTDDADARKLLDDTQFIPATDETAQEVAGQDEHGHVVFGAAALSVHGNSVYLSMPSANEPLQGRTETGILAEILNEALDGLQREMQTSMRM